MITPFHFACFCEERLRAQFAVLDKPLGSFVQILRRFSLIENRAALNFCAVPASGEEAVPHVTLSIERVPQKDEKTAFNCFLSCPTQKLQKNFRVLLIQPKEAETQILKILEFLQKAFLPLGYTTATSGTTVDDTLEKAKALMNAAAGSTAANDEALSDEAKALTGGKKYIVADAAQGEPVRMRTQDGKYVPDGQLPATIRVGKPS